MNRLMKPERLDLDPSAPNAAKEWRHWRRTFDNFIIECGIDPVPNKHGIITTLISANVYEHVEDCTDFQSVIDTLDNLFVKSPNVIFARHLPLTRRQQSGETLDQFLQDLRKLSKDYKFKDVTAEPYREKLGRDAFINGLFSPAISQRLLESDTISLQNAYDKGNSLDLAQKNADTYSMYSAHTAATSSIPQPSALSDDSESSSLAAAWCYFCGGSYHNRRVCTAREACCNNCNKKGHFRKVCRPNSNAGTTATIYEDPSAIAAIHGFPTYNCTTGITAAFPQSLPHAAVPLSIHGHTLTALIYSCSSDSFMSENIAKMLKLKIKPSSSNISMALSTMNTRILGYCEIDLKLN